MLRELLTLLVLAAALLAFLYWQWRRSRQAETTTIDATGQPFHHEYSPEIGDNVSKRLFPEQDPAALRALFETFQFKFSARGTFLFTPPEGSAAGFARRFFAPTEVQQVLDTLKTYRSGSSASDTELMHVHILKAANGDAGRIASLVKEAEEDFRDVICLAEPAAMEALGKEGRIHLDGPEVKLAHDRDLQQYVLWLLKYADYRRLPPKPAHP